MAQNHTEVEQMMKDLNCTGDRITSELINSRIAEVDYQTITLAGQKLMYCGIKMDNGFVVVGKPATCIDPANWRDEIGQKISYDNTFSEIWKLEAYRKLSAA
jgi:Phage protein (N4 Gp49/phage Sf6 gene 66) family